MKTPFAAIFAILLGGAVGDILHMLRKRSSRKTWLVEGVLVGAVALAVLYLKPDLMTLAPGVLGTELGVFGLAALAGFMGTPLLDLITALVLPGLAAADKTDKPKTA